VRLLSADLQLVPLVNPNDVSASRPDVVWQARQDRALLGCEMRRR